MLFKENKQATQIKVYFVENSSLASTTRGRENCVPPPPKVCLALKFCPSVTAALLYIGQQLTVLKLPGYFN